MGVNVREVQPIRIRVQLKVTAVICGRRDDRLDVDFIGLTFTDEPARWMSNDGHMPVRTMIQRAASSCPIVSVARCYERAFQ